MDENISRKALDIAIKSGHFGDLKSLIEERNAKLPFILSDKSNSAFRCNQVFHYGTYLGIEFYSDKIYDEKITLTIGEFGQGKDLSKIQIQNLSMNDDFSNVDKLTILNLYNFFKSHEYHHIVFGVNENHGMIAFVNEHEYKNKCDRFGSVKHTYHMDFEVTISEDKSYCEGHCHILTLPLELTYIINRLIIEKGKVNVIKFVLNKIASYYGIQEIKSNIKKVNMITKTFENRELTINHTNRYNVLGKYDTKGLPLYLPKINKKIKTVNNTSSCSIM